MFRNGFVKKNVGTLTLGERLSKTRSEKRITLSEVSRSAKIQMKYLEYLENGQYEKLPADVYVKGFIRSYAQYLGMDENYLIKLYEREKEIHNNVKKEDPKKSFSSPIKFSSLVITPKAIIAVLIVFFVGLGFFYLYRELSIFISSPRLVVIAPADNFTTENRNITVEGVTEKDSELFINNQSIVVDENGKFSEELALQLGINTINVKSVNRFNKESDRTIIGEAKFQDVPEENNPADQPTGDQENPVENAPTKFSAEVYGNTKPAAITVKVDDAVVFSGTISPGTVKSFEAENKISVSADKGKYVGVRINGKDLGTLSKDTKPVNNRVFMTQ
jgi:cytoskeletal protein RodZ